MLTLPHTLAAAVLVKIFPNPYLCLPLALLSHFFLDFFVPHWNPHLFTEFKKTGRVSWQSILLILVDAAISLGFCLYILLKFWPDFNQVAIFAGAIFLATLPDTIEIPYYFFRSQASWLKKYVKFEHKYQANANVFWGITTQVIVIILCLLVFTTLGN